VDGAPITQATADGYEIKVTGQDGTEYVSVGPKDADGLNSFDKYIKNIPILHETHQPDGAAPTVTDPDTGEITLGETAVIHVYHLGEELYFQSHAGLEFTVGEEGSLPTEIDLDVVSTCPADGDVNGDGYVSALDAVMVLKHSVHMITLDACEQDRSDVNGDSFISALDAVCILKHSVHMSSCLSQ
jgi:hypothetical protein